MVVDGLRLDRGNQERARRKCLEALLWELDQWAVSAAVLESRTQTLNLNDMHLVDALRSQKRLSSGLRVEFGLPSAEPMLWIPDAVAGAIAASRKGAGEHRARLGEMVQEIELQL